MVNVPKHRDGDAAPDPTVWKQPRIYQPLSPEGKEAFRQKMNAGRLAKQADRAALRANLQDVPITHRFHPRHWEVLIRHLSGYSNTEISGQMGYRSPMQVRHILKRPEIMAAIDEIRAHQLQKVMEGDFGPLAIAKANAVPAMKKQVDLLNAKSESVQLNASQSVLGHAGFGERVQVDVFHRILGTLTDTELDDYASGRRIPEKLRAVLPAIDITPEKD